MINVVVPYLIIDNYLRFAPVNKKRLTIDHWQLPSLRYGEQKTFDHFRGFTIRIVNGHLSMVNGQFSRPLLYLSQSPSPPQGGPSDKSPGLPKPRLLTIE